MFYEYPNIKDKMKNYESSYINILSAFVEHLHEDIENVDPVRINMAKFYARALFVAYAYSASYKSEKEIIKLEAVERFLSLKFSKDNFFSWLIRRMNPRLIKIFETENKIVPNIPISVLYENLLNIETLGTEIRTGKEYRNKLGSYYTPLDYAQEITKRTISLFVKKNGKDKFLKAKIVDFSCGGGVFYISLLSHLKTLGYSNNEIKTVVMNLYGFDVDPIALEIAKLSILDYAQMPEDYDTICKHFHHGNFLLHTSNECSKQIKVETAMKGFIYHENLAIGKSFLEEYDIILGNPPWEKIRLEEKKFYAQYTKQIEFVNFRFELSSTIENSQMINLYLKKYAEEYKKQLEIAKKHIKGSTFFKCSTNGELNTCSLFTDAAYNLLSPIGFAGLFIKSTLVTAKVNKKLFDNIKRKVISVYDFINRNKIFDIDSRERFSILILGKKSSKNINLGMNLVTLSDIDSLSEVISIDVFEKLNPETKMIPNFNSGKDIILLSKLYERFSIFSKCYPSAKYGRLVHLTNHVQDIQKEQTQHNIPIFEGKFFSLFDNAYSGFNNVPFAERYKSKATAKKLSEIDKKNGVKPLCRFFISESKWKALSKGFDSEYMLAWHSLTSATNVRSCVATLLPFIPGSQSVQFLTMPDVELMIYLTGLFNSISFDYIIKCKLNGIDLTQSVINQIPVPTKEEAQSTPICLKNIEISAFDIILNIVKCFYKDDKELTSAFAGIEKVKCGFENLSRHELFYLLDAVIAHLYHISEEELHYILSQFSSFYSEEDKIEIICRYKSIQK